MSNTNATTTTPHTTTTTTTATTTVTPHNHHHVTLSERLQQARQSRRSFGAAAVVAVEAGTTSTTTGSDTGSSSHGTTSNGTAGTASTRITAATTGSTTGTNCSTTAATTPPPPSSSSSSSSQPRYRTLPGLVATTPPSFTTTTTTTASLGRYRPSSAGKSQNVVTAASTTSTTIITANNTTVSPARTWRNIHELVQKIESTDRNTGSNSNSNSNSNGNSNSNSNSSGSGVSSSNSFESGRVRSNTTNSTTNHGSASHSNNVKSSREALAAPNHKPTSAPPPSQPAPSYHPSYKYRNLHHTISSSNPEATTTRETFPPPDTLESPPVVMNRWKYHHHSTTAAAAAQNSNPGADPVHHHNHRTPVPSLSATVAPQYSFGSTTTSTTNGRSGTGSSSSHNHATTTSNATDWNHHSKPVDTSPSLLGPSHSFASSTHSSLSGAGDGGPLPVSSVSPTASGSGRATSDTTTTTTTMMNHHYQKAVPTSTNNVITSTTSPVSLTLSNSRSFGSQPSMLSKSPSTDATISTVPSWKSGTTPPKKKSETVYGSPVPAWKKKLLEQQRLQQQEKVAPVVVPKWKQRQLEQKQQQQQRQSEPEPALNSNLVVGPTPSSTTDAAAVPLSPSDERPDDVAVAVDQVIASVFSNAAVLDDSVTTTTTTTKHSPTTTTRVKKWTPPNTTNPSKAAVVGRPKLRLGASPDVVESKTKAPWAHPKSLPSHNAPPPPTSASSTLTTMDLVGAASEDTVSIPSPGKDDPAEQSGIGESTMLLSPRRRGDLGISTVDTSSTTVGRSSKAWESPRTARLEAMKVNQTNTTPSSAFSRPGPKEKASPVVVPSQFVQSPEPITTKKWQPPRKETPKPTTFAPLVKDTAESIERMDTLASTTESNAVETTTEESNKKSSVAEMKAKLWGTGKTEKLVVASVSKDSPDVRYVESFASPTRSNANQERQQAISMTPPKPNSAVSKSVGPASKGVPSSFTRGGRPDVCTPNGPLPPQRSNHRDDQQLPPRRNLDTLWMNRLEQANHEGVAAAASQPESHETPMDRPSDKPDDIPHDNRFGPSVYDNDAVYAGNTVELTEHRENDSVLPPPPPPAEKSSHYRSPSLGDFQVAANQSVKETVDDVANKFVSSPPVSPRVSRPSDPISPTIRPAVMTKWDDIPVPPSHSDSVSPTSRRLLPPKLPPTSPVATEKKEGKGNFSEMIDCPPLDDSEKWGTDADITGPKELIDSLAQPLSPRPKQDRPWKKDANTLSPSTWMKPKADPPSDISTPTRVDPPSSVEEEKKTGEDALLQAQSPSSLMRMAADSIHAVDYDKAVQGLQRRSIMDEDEDSLLSAATPGSTIPAVLPPEFEKAISDTEGYDQTAHVPIFGDPTSYGAAGGDTVAEPPVCVADRARALASWNGGHGVSPTRTGHPDNEIAPTLSPIVREESESEVEGMSPRITKRGYGLDDWKRTKSFDSKSEFETSSDFWQPSNIDNQSQIDEKEWSRFDPEVDGSNIGRSNSTNQDIVSSAPTPAPAVTSTQELKKSTPPLLEKSKMDTGSRPKMTWKKKPLVPKPDGTSIPPRPLPKSAGSVKSRKSDISHNTQSTANHENTHNFDPFDPFEFSFNTGTDKVEFTEPTEFSEGTDFFSAGDPFQMDPSSFPKLQEQRPPTDNTATHVTPALPSGSEHDDGDADAEYDDEYVDEEEYPPALYGLNPPSGSTLGQYEVWSYDADTSNYQDGGTAEI